MILSNDVHKPLRFLTPEECFEDDFDYASQMPKVSGISGPYLFYFYSFDCAEAIHVHVRRERNEAKFWLDPVTLARNRGFSSRELNEIRRIIVGNEPLIIEAWHEHCGSD